MLVTNVGNLHHCCNIRLILSLRNEVAKSSCDSNAFVGGLQTELAQLQIRFDQVSLDLTSTRSERDSTVSEMRQEIERLNLLHGDQRLIFYH